MNREILFRGKSIGYKDDFWAYGGLLQYDEDMFHIIENNQRIWDISHDGILIDSKTIGQYTGLKDKNGVKIFEGDLIQLCDNKKGSLVVEFRNAYVGGWVLTYKNTSELLSLGARKREDLLIIGNIHEKNE